MYTNAYPLMQARDIKSTSYMITDKIGTVGFPTAGQLQEMNAAGHDIGNHTKTHAQLDGLSLAAATAELTDGKAALDALGLTRASSHVAYPNGRYGGNALQAMSDAGMLTGRTCDRGVETFSEINTLGKYRLEIFYWIGGTTTISDLVAAVNAIRWQKRILIVLFHTIGVGSGSYDISVADFTTFLDAVVASGVQTMTISQLYAEYVSRYGT